MKGLKKRGLSLVLTLVMVLSLSIFAGIGANSSVSQAKTWTKASVKSEIKKTQKKLKTAQKRYKAAKKKYNKQTKGTFAVFGATTISYNPLIVYYAGILNVDKGYYWVVSGENNYSTLGGIGYFKNTGKTRMYNGYTCSVVKCVKVTSMPSIYEDQIKTLKKKLKKLNGALSFKAHFYGFEDADGFYSQLGEDGNETQFIDDYVGDVVFMVKNQTIDLNQYITHDKYNSLSFRVDVTSGNSDIISLTESGELTINGSGSFYIDVDCSISGERTSLHCIAAVYEEEPDSEDEWE